MLYIGLPDSTVECSGQSIKAFVFGAHTVVYRTMQSFAQLIMLCVLSAVYVKTVLKIKCEMRSESVDL